MNHSDFYLLPHQGMFAWFIPMVKELTGLASDTRQKGDISKNMSRSGSTNCYLKNDPGQKLTHVFDPSK